MNIINNNINELQNIKTNPYSVKKEGSLDFTKNKNINNLPSFHSLGQSQINANLPVSYNKIGEISIPGVKDKASIYKLSNGQRVIIAPKKGPAFIHTTYNVGSMNEPDNLRGISHFIEHNLFNGSRNLAPKEYDKKVSQLGGETNASTGFAPTDYYLQVQLLNNNSLEEAIKLNAEQTQFPTFPVEQLIKEKEPVKSEIDMCSDDPNTIAICKTLKNLFKIQTSSEDFVIGTKENINSFTKEDVVDYFNTWYTPDNAVTVITGDVNPDETINIVAKYFNKKNDYSNIHKRKFEPVQYNDKPVREDIIRQNTNQPSITMGFAIPEGASELELNKLDLLFSIMGATNSNLNKALDKLGASVEFSVENMQNKPQGVKAVLINAYAPEDKLEETIKTIYSEITNISNYTPLLEDVNNAKKRITNDLLSSTESSRSLNNILTNALLTNNYDYINSKINDMQFISPQDISLTAKKYLDLNKISMCVSHDKNATNESINNQYKSSISFKGKYSTIDNIKEETSKIYQTKLPNNIESTVIKGNSNAKSNILIDFNTDELNNVTSPEFMILNEMLNRGSSYRGADNFNSILNSKDISLFFDLGVDGLSVKAECYDENIQDIMHLIKESINYPNFTQNEFIRAKQLVKDSIQTENISAFDKLYKELNPNIKKYANKETRLQELENIKLSDIQNLYSKIFCSSQVQALMTAPIDKNPNLTNLFNSELSIGFGTYKPFSLNKNENYNIYKPNMVAKVITEVREQSQAEIVQGYKYKKPENIDDIAKIELLNLILGASGMSSRLFSDLREDKKLAYSVGSSIVNEKDTEILCLRIATTTESPNKNEGSSENITKSIEGFNQNINKLKSHNVSEQELQAAKNKFKTIILNNLETNMSKSLSYIKSKYSYYGINYNEKLIEAIDKISADDIRNTANYVFKNPAVTSIAASKKTLDELNLK